MLFTAEGNSEASQRQIEELKASVQNLEAKLKRQNDDADKVKKELGEAKASAKATEGQLQAQVAELTKSVESAQVKHSKQQKEADDLQKKIDALGQTTLEKDKEITALRSAAAESSSAKVAALKKELEEKFRSDLDEAAKAAKEKVLETSKKMQEEMKEKLAAQAKAKDAEITVCLSRDWIEDFFFFFVGFGELPFLIYLLGSATSFEIDLWRAGADQDAVCAVQD